MHRLGTVLTAALVAIGCGSGSEPRSDSTAAAGASSSYPVAYRIPNAIARKLPQADAYAVIEREGQVVAQTEWEDYTALVLSAWLEEKHGIRLDAPEYRAVTSRLASEQELYVIAVTGEHAAALQRLHPNERALRRYFARFTEDGYSEAGEAMLDWLRVFRLASSNADVNHVVVIPVLD